MSYVDVLIPAVMGLLLVVMPTAFTKPTGEGLTDAARQKKLRWIGALLLGVAAIYLLLKLGRQP